MLVVNCKSNKFDVYGGRNKSGSVPMRPGSYGWLGNPYKIGNNKCGTLDRDGCIAMFKRYFWNRINTDKDYLWAVLDLKGKTVGCYCKPDACHLDVIASWFDAGCPVKHIDGGYAKLFSSSAS